MFFAPFATQTFGATAADGSRSRSRPPAKTSTTLPKKKWKANKKKNTLKIKKCFKKNGKKIGDKIGDKTTSGEKTPDLYPQILFLDYLGSPLRPMRDDPFTVQIPSGLKIIEK